MFNFSIVKCQIFLPGSWKDFCHFWNWICSRCNRALFRSFQALENPTSNLTSWEHGTIQPRRRKMTCSFHTTKPQIVRSAKTVFSLPLWLKTFLFMIDKCCSSWLQPVINTAKKFTRRLRIFTTIIYICPLGGYNLFAVTERITYLYPSQEFIVARDGNLFR